MRTAALLSLAVAGLAGCYAEPVATGPDGASFAIVEETVRLRPGAETRLTLRGTLERHTLQARASEVVSVNTDGHVRAKAPGITWIVGESGAMRDSVRVVVSLTDSPQPGIAFQLTSNPDTLRLTGISRIYQSMFNGKRWTQVTAAVNASEPAELRLSDLFRGENTMLILQVDGVLQPGSRAVTPWRIETTPAGNLRVVGAEGALVWIRDPAANNRIHIYVPVSPVELEIDRAELPVGVGPANGMLVGRLSFEGAGLIAVVDSNGTRIVGQVSTQTRIIYAEFSLGQRLQPLGGVRASLSGGPSPFEPTSLGSPMVVLWHGGLLVQAGGLTKTGAINTQVWVGSPRTADIAVGPVTIEELAAGNAHTSTRTFAWTETGVLEELEAGGPFANLALSTGGNMKITRFEAPGESTWGLLEAVLTSRQVLMLGGAPNATQDVMLEILAPVAPTSRNVFVPAPSVLTNTDTIRTGPGIVRVSNGKLTLPGRVVETDVTPVPDVRITLSWSNGAVTVRTNNSGEFEFTGVNPGTYEVRFDVPQGFQLADHQPAVIGPIELTPARVFLPIALADAQGNGALRVIATRSDANEVVDGVQAHVRAQGSSTVITTLVTGKDRPGMARTKLPPGDYDVDVVLPPGYKFAAGQSATASIRIRKGHESFIPVSVVRQ